MQKNKLAVLFALILSCVFQLISFYQDQSTFYQNGFMIGLNKELVNNNFLASMLPLLLPIIFILFFTGGGTENLIHGYGKILIIRNCSKTALILKNSLSNCVKLICIILFQLLLFIPINKSLLPVEQGMLKSLPMYFLTLSALVLLQGFLEFYIPSHIVNIIIFAYCFVSYFLAQVVFSAPVAKIILFPCLMFGEQNSSCDAENIYFLYLAAVIVINLLLLKLIIRKFKKADIF